MPPNTKWTEEEDHTLLRVYTAIADDLDRDEEEPTFWKEVQVALYSDYLQEPRNVAALQARWRLISKHVAYFAECIGHLAACDEAEEDNENEELISDALTLFKKTTDHRFKFLHCWEYLKTWPKFKLLVLNANVREDTEAGRVVDAALAAAGNQQERKTKKRCCGCFRNEGCAACGRCLERHCVCGMSARRRRTLCLESRACSCPLLDPADRCKLCHGCRRKQGDAHCRCVQHQKFMWIRRHPEMETELTEEEEKNWCNCLQLSDGYGGAVNSVEQQNDVAEKRERLRRLKRATGMPSSDNIFRKKITPCSGDEEIERDFDDGEEEDSGANVIAPSAAEDLPRSIERHLLGFRNPPPYHPLLRSEGCSLLETIEPRNERMRTMHEAALRSHATQQEVNRGLDNLTYEIDRTNNMPPDGLVDFLVYMASIKASDVGELIGTFEDSAAVAASIIVEEYMAQLVDDATLGKTSLCPPTESSVTAFTQELLVGFNWRCFQQQNLGSQQEMIDNVTALVLHEFVSVQPRTWDLTAHTDELTSWIRKAVVIPRNEQQTSVATLDEEPSTTEIEEAEGENKADGGVVNDDEGISRPATRVRMSVKPHPVFGTPTYKLSYSSTLEDGHHVETSVGGIKSKPKANATIDQLSKAVERQDHRSRNAPPPPPDPYELMWDFLNQHIIEYKTTRPESDGEEPEVETASMKRSRARKRQKLQLQEEIAARKRLLNSDGAF